MNITQEKVNDLNAVVKITLTPEDYTPKVEKAIKEHAKKAHLPGFRKGMVPLSHIKRLYGKSILADEINNLLDENISKYLTDNQIEILGQPLPDLIHKQEYKWDYTDTFHFNYELGLAPKINVQITSKDNFTQYLVKADAETLAARIKNIRKSYGKMTNPEVSAEGDVLYAELVQLDADGAILNGGINNISSIRLDLVSDKEILKSLLGLKKDSQIEVDIQKAFNQATIAKLLNISEDAAANLKAKFKLTVKNVNRLEEADLNQEFFEKLFGAGAVTDQAGFEAKIKEEIESMFKLDADLKLQNDIHAQLIEQTKIELPDEFLRKWLKSANEKLTDEELEQGYADFAEKLRWTLIENKIIKDNDIKIDYKDVFEQAKVVLNARFKMYGSQPLPENQLAQYATDFLQKKENANRIFEEVKASKVFDYIKQAATLNEKEIDYNKFVTLK